MSSPHKDGNFYVWYFAILIFWSVNFHSGNMVRDWQTELSAKESDLRQSLQISQISIWIRSISEWCNFDHHTSHSGRRFSEEKNWWRWDLICDCCESLGRGFTPSGLLGLCWPQPIRGWAVEHCTEHWAGSPLGFYCLMISMLSLAFSRHSLLSWGEDCGGRSSGVLLFQTKVYDQPNYLWLEGKMPTWQSHRNDRANYSESNCTKMDRNEISAESSIRRAYDF